MTTKVLYAGYQRYFLETAKILAAEVAWDPAYWIVVPSIAPEIEASFPNAIRHGQFDAIKGIPPRELEGMPLPALSPDRLAAFAYHEAMVLRMLERNDSHTDSFKYRDRVELYYFLLRYWEGVLDRLGIGVVIFEEAPHQASDYVLYAVARDRGVRTVLFVRTPLKTRRATVGTRMRFFPVRSFEEGSAAIRMAYDSAVRHPASLPLSVSSDLDDYFRELSGGYESVLALHLYDQAAEARELLDATTAPGVGVRDAFRGARKLVAPKFWLTRARLMLGDASTKFQSDQKQKGKSFADSRLTYPEHIYYKSRAILKKRRLWAEYEKLAEKHVPMDVPFIFCALHYQPEQSTSPLGGYFVDQLLMVELLAESLRPGWRLYVKDHVSQYVSGYTRYGESFRSRRFFERLAAMRGVSVISLTHDTFQLIDHSLAVATVTGTTGWEAVVRGRPALVFGHAWYRGCEGAFSTQTRSGLENALQQIESGYSVDREKVKLFGSIVERHSFEGVIGGPGEQQYYNLTDKDNARAHADAILSLMSQES